MHRIDGPGATVDNKFTEGNPALNIPATVVTDDIMNDIQEELAQFIETSAGLTLAKGVFQLEDAINSFISGGGSDATTLAIANNQGAAASLTGLSFNSANEKAVQIEYSIERRTDTQDVVSSGVIFLIFRTRTSSWDVSFTENLEASGVDFTVTSGGQVEYTSDDLTGTSYVGEMRIGKITRMAA